MTATHSRPLLSHAICTGLASSGNSFFRGEQVDLHVLGRRFILLDGIFAARRKGACRSGRVPGLLVLTAMNGGVLPSSTLQMAHPVPRPRCACRGWRSLRRGLPSRAGHDFAVGLRRLRIELRRSARPP